MTETQETYRLADLPALVAARKPESLWQAEVIRLAVSLGWKRVLIYHTHDARRSQAGFPDLVLVKPPRLVFAELKAARGRVEQAQALWLEALSQCPGVESYVWRPSDRAEVQRILMGMEAR